MSGDQHPSTR
jgi:hypothetical protein